MAKAEERWTRVEDFTDGFLHKRDVTQMPAGALIIGSQNVRINDADRVGVRRGSEKFGASSTATTPITSMHTMKKRTGDNVMMRAYDDKMEYYNSDSDAWENLKSEYTTGLSFGFADHNVNTEALDFVYYCNAVDQYTKWTGSFTKINGALSGGESSIPVDTVLEDRVYHTDTSSASSTTTLDIATAKWGTDLWNGFYVRITSGAQSGKISKISATTTTKITFTTIAGLSGTPTFEVRKVAYRDNTDRVLRIGGVDVAYGTFTDDSTFSSTSGVPAALDGVGITQGVQEYAKAPRGNILLVDNTRMFVANVGGNEQALYYSKIADATDFTFSSPRIADDGGIIDTPEGGGGITGLGIQEEVIYILKEDIIKTLTFTQDANDLPIIKQLIQAPEVGAEFSKGVFKIDNKLFFTAKDGGIKSIGQVSNINFVQALQLSDPIVNFVDDLDFSSASAIFFKQKAYIACASSSTSVNDTVLVYNAPKQAWEAPIKGWNVADWTIYNSELYYGSSLNPETFKAEVKGLQADNNAPFKSVARFAYNNYGAPELIKEFQTFFVEGYISQNTKLIMRLLYNYLGVTEIKTFSITGTDSDIIISDSEDNVLGMAGLGMWPLAGTLGETDSPNPDNLPKFRVYFPLKVTPFYEIAPEFSSDQEGDQWEILRFATDAELKPETYTNLKKSIT